VSKVEPRGGEQSRTMKKRLLLIISAIVLLSAGGGIYFWFNAKRPPLETKFVQNEGQSTNNKEQSQKDIPPDVQTEVSIKTPGSSALVTIPTHTYQTFNNCGPATLSMALAFNGVNVSQKELGDQMRPYQIASGDNDDKTIFTYEFVDWAEKYNVEAIGRINGDINTLKTFTANGIPVIVKTWLHMNEDIGHFRIVRGFDEANQVIIQDDSYEGPNRKIPYYDFLSMWQPFNYSYVIVYTPQQAGLVEAIIGAEMNENLAWENSLTRAQKEALLDTESPYPLFNQSRAYYHLGDYKASVEAYEKVENRLPRRMLWYEIEPIWAYQKLGNFDRVFQITDKILSGGNRAYSELYQIRGEIYLAQGNKDAARREFELAIQYNKNFQPAKDSISGL
jgi:tetratricopeptide (TPR) repeat protein